MLQTEQTSPTGPEEPQRIGCCGAARTSHRSPPGRYRHVGPKGGGGTVRPLWLAMWRSRGVILFRRSAQGLDPTKAALGVVEDARAMGAASEALTPIRPVADFLSEAIGEVLRR